MSETEGIERDDSGRAKLASSGVATDAIFERFLAGESVALMAEDYGVTPDEIERALRFESMEAKRMIEAMRELLREKCFWTGCYGPGKFTREGYSMLVEVETCYRDVDYRNEPLWETPDQAIDEALKQFLR